jgi:hypothetical protein
LIFNNIKASYKPDSVHPLLNGIDSHLSSPTIADRVKRATFHSAALGGRVCSCSGQGLPRTAVTGRRSL